MRRQAIAMSKPLLPFTATTSTAPTRRKRWTSGAVALGRSLVLPTGLLALGAASGWWVGYHRHGTHSAQLTAAGSAPGAVGLPSPPTAIRSGTAGLAHELVACEEPDHTGHMAAVQKAVEAALASAQAAGQVGAASVAVVDLEAGGRWLLDPDREYFPASMLKLPLAIAWMHYAERHPGVLDQQLLFDYAQSEREGSSPHALQTGQRYTPRELLRRMLSYSRNDAKALLQQHLPEAELRATYAELRLPWPYRDETHDAVITTRHMVRVFESLYNAAWLERESAELLLQMLIASDFDDAMVSGLPKGTQVAHKWGHRDVPGGSGLQAAHTHDCGIIYKQQRPYLFCAMTMGNKGWQLTRVIGQLSRAAWNALP